MRFEYIDPFLTSTLRVLHGLIPGRIIRGEIMPVRADRIPGQVTVAIRMTGEAEGDVIIGMNTETAISVSSLLTGVTFVSVTPNALDALAELANMIAGNAVSELNDLGFDFNVSPPAVSFQPGVSKGYGEREAVQIPLLLECGEMTMNVLLGTD